MAPNLEKAGRRPGLAHLANRQSCLRVKCSGPSSAYLPNLSVVLLVLQLQACIPQRFLVPCPCMHSEMMAGKGVNCSVRVTQADGLSEE